MKTLLFAVALIALAGLNFVVAAQADDDTRKELEAVYAKVDAAIKTKDIKTLEAFLAEDYEGRGKGDAEKPRNRAETVKMMKDGLEKIKEFTEAKTTINKIEQVEGNYIVDYTQTMTAAMTGPDGKDHTLEVVAKGRDWWIKDDDGKWLRVAGEDMGRKTKLDGAAID